jgi:prepilin-type N-terminal cleavage/methylation domain-containing protein
MRRADHMPPAWHDRACAAPRNWRLRGLWFLSRIKSTAVAESAGFTLIEVLAALAVLAVGLVSIGSLVAVGAKGTRATEEHLVATETSRAIMTGLLSQRDVQANSTAGETAGFRWRLDVVPYTGEPVGQAQQQSHWQPFAMVLTVRSPGGRTIQINTVRLRRSAQP